jgi:hypothetical protein
LNTDTRNNDRCALVTNVKRCDLDRKTHETVKWHEFTPAPQAEPAEVCGCSHLESQHEADVCTAPNPREHETELGVCYCNDFDPERDDSFRWQTFSVVPAEDAGQAEVPTNTLESQEKNLG